MTVSIKSFSLTLLALSLVACGGSNSASDNPTNKVTPTKPLNVKAVSKDGLAIVSWDSSVSLEYDIYLATEEGLKFDSYATYDNSEWIKDVSSPYAFKPDDYSKKYFFTVVSKSGTQESEQSAIVSSIPRYQPDGEVVIDFNTSLIWARCSIGQTWSELTQSCEGEALRISQQEAQSIAIQLGEGWRVPSKGELISLVYCSNGVPDYFLLSADESCESQDVSAPTIYQLMFPNVAIESVYLSGTRKFFNGYPNMSFYYGVSFLEGKVASAFGNEPTAKYARLVKDQ